MTPPAEIKASTESPSHQRQRTTISPSATRSRPSRVQAAAVSTSATKTNAVTRTKIQTAAQSIRRSCSSSGAPGDGSARIDAETDARISGASEADTRRRRTTTVLVGEPV